MQFQPYDVVARSVAWGYLNCMATTNPPELDAGLPGCGLGLYAMLLMFICLLGLIGMVGGTIGLLNSEPNEARSLVHGSEVQTWRLQPMRNAGLLELTEVPGAWHDESPMFDGTTSCVIRATSVGRLEDGIATEIPWEAIDETEVERTEQERMSITVRSTSASFTCHFGPDEGADRFLRQVESERKKATGEPPIPTSPDEPAPEPASIAP